MTHVPTQAEQTVADQLASEKFRAKMDEFFERAFGSVPTSERLQVPGNYEGIKALVDQGVDATMLTHQVLRGMTDGLVALQRAVPQGQVSDDVRSLVYAIGVVLDRFTDEIDTLIRADAMSYAASALAPDAASADS